MRKWNRREFTRNVGMMTLFSPFIGMLEPSLAKAQSTGPAKYLLIMVSNGTDPAIWQPTVTQPIRANQSDTEIPR